MMILRITTIMIFLLIIVGNANSQTVVDENDVIAMMPTPDTRVTQVCYWVSAQSNTYNPGDLFICDAKAVVNGNHEREISTFSFSENEEAYITITFRDADDNDGPRSAELFIEYQESPLEVPIAILEEVP